MKATVWGRIPELWLFYLVMIATEINKISYWNENARWYKLWREHNSYHEPIKRILLNFVHEGIKVLDIGAGDGVLSFPLVKKGCYVTALEPSFKMQEYLFERARNYEITINVDRRKFEDLEIFELRQYDFALACNSLHLTEDGIEASLCKLFSSKIERIFLVTEKNFSLNELKLLYPEYKVILNYSYICESSFAYHSLQEVFEHWQFKYRRELFPWEKEKLLKTLSYEKGHFWLKDFALVNIFYWRREI